MGYTREWERGTFFTTGEKFTDFQFCLPILPAYLPLKFPNGQFPLKTPGPISPTTLEQNNKKQFFFFTHGGDYTWVEQGYFFATGKKFNDFKSCLPNLPAYLPLKFPYGQFPLKIPGPISQAKLKQKKEKKFKWRSCDFTQKSLLVNLITFLANRIRLVVAAPI